MGLLCLSWDQTGLEREVVKSGLIVFDCDGNETKLSGCSISSWNRAECSHRQDVGVICSSDLILLEDLLMLLCKKVLLM